MYGYNYVENGWLGDIFDIMTSDGIYFLKTNVSPSQPGVGRNDYKAWVAVSSELNIITAHCTCPAGNGRSCSHISAVIYAVTLTWKHGVAGVTCTDRKQVWGKGAAKVLAHDPLTDISFSRPDLEQLKSGDKDHVPNPKLYLDHAELEKAVRESSVKDLWDCKGTLLSKVLNAPHTELNDI